MTKQEKLRTQLAETIISRTDLPIVPVVAEPDWNDSWDKENEFSYREILPDFEKLNENFCGATYGEIVDVKIEPYIVVKEYEFPFRKQLVVGRNNIKNYCYNCKDIFDWDEVDDKLAKSTEELLNQCAKEAIFLFIEIDKKVDLGKAIDVHDYL